MHRVVKVALLFLISLLFFLVVYLNSISMPDFAKSYGWNIVIIACQPSFLPEQDDDGLEIIRRQQQQQKQLGKAAIFLMTKLEQVLGSMSEESKGLHSLSLVASSEAIVANFLLLLEKLAKIGDQLTEASIAVEIS